ncbi:unnamed protein product [Lactuca virosa]|uniref:Uncharacterized protein n=1 Tax=Lactuca virosa TaxID=75947 RepID=A0AAU9NT95_9ASTR|nr:unnamed protein product [Lactuca virosa]
MYVDHFGNSNMQEWLDEHKDEVVGNIQEKVLDGSRLIKEVATRHRDVADIDDEEENGIEEDDEDEDDDENPYFLIKDNGIQVDMGENAGVGDSFEEDMGDNEDVYPELPNIFNDKLNLKEQEHVLEGVWDDEVMVDAGDALETTGREEKMVGVNGRVERVKVNARVRQVQHVRPPNKRKKSERIIKMKLVKNVRGEGSSPARAMDLD